MKTTSPVRLSCEASLSPRRWALPSTSYRLEGPLGVGVGGSSEGASQRIGLGDERLNHMSVALVPPPSISRTAGLTEHFLGHCSSTL